MRLLRSTQAHSMREGLSSPLSFIKVLKGLFSLMKYRLNQNLQKRSWL